VIFLFRTPQAVFPRFISIICTGKHRLRFRPEDAAPRLAPSVPQQTSANLMSTGNFGDPYMAASPGRRSFAFLTVVGRSVKTLVTVQPRSAVISRRSEFDDRYFTDEPTAARGHGGQ
jgi:hypothetical protein